MAFIAVSSCFALSFGAAAARAAPLAAALEGSALEAAKSKVGMFNQWVLYQAGTEIQFTGRTANGFGWDNKQQGVYASPISGAPLFSSEAKYDSGTGWPSFWAPVDSSAILTRMDPKDKAARPDLPRTWRVEVLDRASMTHLGHVFPDGPAPTGKRYCLNAAALWFLSGQAPTADASQATLDPEVVEWNEGVKELLKREQASK